MNAQIRRLFVVCLALFAVLGVAVTLVQFVFSPSLVADQRNARRYLQAAERDRGPIIVADSPVAISTRVDGTNTYQREYPEGPLYAAVTGYFSAVNSSATGIEAAENEVLEGGISDLLWQRVRNLLAGKPRQGGGVVLTVNPAMQQVAADLIGDRPGAAVALDVKTGAILTLYSSPSYDPTPLASLSSEVAATAAEQLEQDPGRPLDNRAIAGNRYAPGSTFKILTTIALLENGVSPGAEMESPRTIILPGTTTEVGNPDGTECGNGTPTLAEAFARSCNTTFMLAVQNLPQGALQDVTTRFGFGQPLNIPLAVTPSVIPEQLNAAELAISSIGQMDVQVTPLQMAMVVQAIANQGTMMHPYLVDHIVDADNQQVAATAPTVLGNPIRSQTAAEVASMMVDAVEKPYGGAQTAALPGVTVAAKTGSAETGNEGKSNGWIVGFAPAEDPQIAIAVMVEGTDTDPQARGWDIAPIMARMLEVGLQ